MLIMGANSNTGSWRSLADKATGWMGKPRCRGGNAALGLCRTPRDSRIRPCSVNQRVAAFRTDELLLAVVTLDIVVPKSLW